MAFMQLPQPQLPPSAYQVPQPQYAPPPVQTSNMGEMIMNMLLMQEKMAAEERQIALQNRELGVMEQRNRIEAEQQNWATGEAYLQPLLKEANLHIQDLTNDWDEVEVPRLTKEIMDRQKSGRKIADETLGRIVDLVDPTLPRTKDFNLVEQLKLEIGRLPEKSQLAINKALEGGDKTKGYGAALRVDEVLSRAKQIAAEDPTLYEQIDSFHRKAAQNMGVLQDYDPMSDLSDARTKYFQDVDNLVAETRDRFNRARAAGPSAIREMLQSYSPSRVRPSVSLNTVAGEPLDQSVESPTVNWDIGSFQKAVSTPASAEVPTVQASTRAGVKLQPTHAQGVGEALHGLVRDPFTVAGVEGVDRGVGYYQQGQEGDNTGLALKPDEMSIIRRAALKRAAATKGRQGSPSPERTRGVSEEAEKIVGRADVELLKLLKQIKRDQNFDANRRSVLLQLAKLIEEGSI